MSGLIEIKESFKGKDIEAVIGKYFRARGTDNYSVDVKKVDMGGMENQAFIYDVKVTTQDPHKLVGGIVVLPNREYNGARIETKRPLMGALYDGLVDLVKGQKSPEPKYARP